MIDEYFIFSISNLIPTPNYYPLIRYLMVKINHFLVWKYVMSNIMFVFIETIYIKNDMV